MAKTKKKTSQASVVMSPEKYIRTKGRTLPVEECYALEDWQEVGMTPVIVARKHVNGNYTVGSYLVDTFCLGVKDSYYYFNVTQDEYDDLLQMLINGDHFVKVPYEVAHNIIFGAISFAEDAGFEPADSFKLTQYLLEEDDDNIPLIEYEFGQDGKYFLVAMNNLELSRYLPTLEKNVPDNFEYEIESEVDFDDEEEDEDDWDDSLDNYPPYMDAQVVMGWTDEKVEAYVSGLQLNHPGLKLLFSPQKDSQLLPDEIQSILELPRETLVADLQHIIRYEIANVNKLLIDNTDFDYLGESAITHALFLLTELRAEESFDTVTELFRQSERFADVYFHEADRLIVSASLCYIGYNQLPRLMEFVKDINCANPWKEQIFTAARYISEIDPQRKEEVRDWFKEVLTSLTTFEGDPDLIFSLQAGLLFDLSDLKDTSLLPNIKEWLESVPERDLICYESYEELEEEIRSSDPPMEPFTPMTILERYEELSSLVK